MLTLTPTAVMDEKPEEGPEVFAVIDGKKVFLPAEAKYVMQDRRGIWYYSTRKPRPKEGDWTPNKTSIACRNEAGYVRALKTDMSRKWHRARHPVLRVWECRKKSSMCMKTRTAPSPPGRRQK